MVFVTQHNYNDEDQRVIIMVTKVCKFGIKHFGGDTHKDEEEEELRKQVQTLIRLVRNARWSEVNGTVKPPREPSSLRKKVKVKSADTVQCVAEQREASQTDQGAFTHHRQFQNR